MEFPETIYLQQKYFHQQIEDIQDMDISASAPDESRSGHYTAEYKLVRCGRVKIIKTLEVEPITSDPLAIPEKHGPIAVESSDIPF